MTAKIIHRNMQEEEQKIIYQDISIILISKGIIKDIKTDATNEIQIAWNSRARRERPEAIDLGTLHFRTTWVSLKTIRKPGFCPLPD